MPEQQSAAYKEEYQNQTHFNFKAVQMQNSSNADAIEMHCWSRSSAMNCRFGAGGSTEFVS